ncbi:hypothetical protein [Alcaligenes faecalis]|uniref:hypothetical protein n=1 Tax=Alcaligenes faecalis TaxID=511 RepID=UPI00122D0EFA|nr:hypothetical protein [Alcaligenes faecalis]
MNTNITRMEGVPLPKQPSSAAIVDVRAASIIVATLAVIALSGCTISASRKEMSLPTPTVDLQRVADVLRVPISIERPPGTTTRWNGRAQNMTADTWQDENLQPTPELALTRALELVLNPDTRDAHRIRDEAFGKKQYLSAARVDPVKCNYRGYGLMKKHGWYCKVSVKAYMWVENR